VQFTERLEQLVLLEVREVQQQLAKTSVGLDLLQLKRLLNLLFVNVALAYKDFTN
jgi:hypothetical protein